MKREARSERQGGVKAEGGGPGLETSGVTRPRTRNFRGDEG